MNIRYLAILVVTLSVSGCSFYDVATNAVDAMAGTGLFSDEDPNYAEWDGLWNPDTSQCIRDEKALRPILRQLDAIEEGKDFVILPTGEKYPLDERSPSEESLLGPTATCLSRTPN